MEVASKGNSKDLLADAKEAEESQNFEDASTLYKNIIEQNPTDQYAYDRLFIMLRKLKDYKQELKFLKSGIKAFEQLNKPEKKKSKKITELSMLLNKATGLTDKKGNFVFKPEPIAKWEKRKLLVEKRLKKK